MKLLFLLSSLAAMAEAMCDHGTSLHRRDGAARFSYTGLAGPLNWHGIGSGNMDCALGHGQSPIDIQPSTTKSVLGKQISLCIRSLRHGHLENLGTTLEVPVNGSLTLSGHEYSLRQFHFHTPSEHRIDGEYYPMEVHFVFQDSKQSLAVLGFLIEVAGPGEKPLELLQNVFTNIDKVQSTGSTTATESLNFGPLVDHLHSSSVFQYRGSLTTPPCAQDVAWNVVEKPIHIDVSTYRAVRHLIKFNARYSQNHPGDVNLLDNARNVLDA
jgi:carbonic anhydrase